MASCGSRGRKEGVRVEQGSGRARAGGIQAALASHQARLRDRRHKGRQADCGAGGGQAQFKEAGSNSGGAFPVLIRCNRVLRTWWD